MGGDCTSQKACITATSNLGNWLYVTDDTMYHTSVTRYVQHGIWICQILFSWIVTDCHIALDFSTNGRSVLSIIINTLCAGTNKSTGQNRMWCAIRKYLSGFQVDSYCFQDLLSWSGLGKWGSSVWGTFSGLNLFFICMFACFHSGHSPGPLPSIWSLDSFYRDVLVWHEWSGRSSTSVKYEYD